jgi:hypothetical protein
VTPRTLADGTVVYGSRRGADDLQSTGESTVCCARQREYLRASDYHSFQAALNRRFLGNVQSQLSYTVVALP